MKHQTIAGLVVSESLGGVASAQSPDADDNGALEEIVVTSQKRAENVQDIPVAVQVVSGATLEAQGIREFSELTRTAPSLFIRPAEHPVNASISMRGIGTFAFSQAVEPSVAVQMDDVPVQFLARAFADLSDIERVEILRGPQSTLFGRSASAGVSSGRPQACSMSATRPSRSSTGSRFMVASTARAARSRAATPSSASSIGAGRSRRSVEREVK